MSFCDVSRLRRNFLKLVGLGAIVFGGAVVILLKDLLTPKQLPTSHSEAQSYMLPLPKFSSNVMLEKAIACRRSIREYFDTPITFDALSMLLWAAQGITEFNYGFRTCPSAGGTYPLEVYVIAGKNCVLLNEGKFLPEGSYRYNCKDHSISLVKAGDLRDSLAKASLNQEWVRRARVNIIIFSVYERTNRVYGDRGYRYVHMECGHVGQNIYLMASALRLGTVAIGAFYDDEVRNVVGAGQDEQPLYVMPVGVPKNYYEIGEEDLSRYYLRVRG